MTTDNTAMSCIHGLDEEGTCTELEAGSDPVHTLTAHGQGIGIPCMLWNFSTNQPTFPSIVIVKE